MTNGSIGNLAEEILNEVKKENLVKLAEYRIFKNAAEHAPAETEIGQLLQKVASLLRSHSDNVTVGDVESFLGELRDAN